MKTPLMDVALPSIYFKSGVRQLLPKRMAKCTPDMYSAIKAISFQLEATGGKLYLSDLYRSHEMQLQAHLDWKSGKKSAFSPPPGASMHEAGRAFDLDLSALKIELKMFWALAANAKVVPIISKPDKKLSEAWHFDCRGSHARVYDYYRAGRGKNFSSPYAAMAASAICATGVTVDFFGPNQQEAAVQFGLVRLGFEVGGVDGNIGKLTREALDQASIAFGDIESVLNAVEDKLQQQFPEEFAISAHVDALGLGDLTTPTHLVLA